jgi:Type VI secretion system/phage-baseplate injector OB domain
MQDLFNSLLTAKEGGTIALDQKGRIPACHLAVVTNNEDPNKQRRILISSPIIPGLDSHWIRRIEPLPFYDPPMPTVGQTVLILASEGDLLNAYYLNCVNDTNAPIKGKKDIIKDSYQEIPGNQTVEIKENLTFQVGKTIRFETNSGSYLELNENGKIIISDSNGVKISLGNSSAIEFSANGGTITGVNLTNFTLLSKSVTTVGAPDTRGDTLIGKGW